MSNRYVVVDTLDEVLLSRTTSTSIGDVPKTPSGKYLLEILDTRDPIWSALPLYTAEQVQAILVEDKGSFWKSLWT